MAVTWHKTNFLGVRYREHATRKHGVRPDRCFSIRYKLNGKDKEEVAGWASEKMSAEKAFNMLSELREAIRTGKGPQTLADMKASNEAEAMQERKKIHAAARAAITFSEFWEVEYLPHAEATKKPMSVYSEKHLFKNWICPVLGNTPLQRITAPMVEQISLTMQKQGKSAASVRYALAVVSQVWSHAAARDLVQGDSPTRRIKKPKVDNRRARFLTREEARALLEALKVHSVDTHDTALLSLFSGLRAGEIHSLTWGDVDFGHGTLYIRDPKNMNSRHAHMTQEVRDMLSSRQDGQPTSSLVFPAANGKRRVEISDTFQNVVRKLGLNNTGETDADGNPVEISDARQRVVFHTLRHTFASWLAQAGTPIFTLAQLMGHSDLKMTQRYSHLAPDNMQAATLTLQGALEEKKPTNVTKFRQLGS